MSLLLETRETIAKDSSAAGMLHHLNVGVVCDEAFGWAVGDG